MVFWKIRFDVSTPPHPQPETEYGYQIMDENLMTVGVYDWNGNKLNGGVNYTTVETENVSQPAWWPGA